MEKKRVQILDALFPPKCMFCGQAAGAKLCESCAAGLPHFAPHERRAETPGLGAHNLAVFRYEGRIVPAVRKIKRTPDRALVSFFAATLADAVAEDFAGDRFDFLAEVPMSPKEVKERGFNHSAILCKALGVRMGVPVLTGVLKEKNNAPPQHDLDLFKRRENAQNAIDIAKARDLCGKHILIVDDIITTGSTLDRCASLFFALGAGSVKYAAICRTLRR